MGIYNNNLEKLMQKYHVYMPIKKVKSFYKTKRVLFKTLFGLFERVTKGSSLFIFTDESLKETMKFAKIFNEIKYHIVNDIWQLEEIKGMNNIKKIIIMTNRHMAWECECELYNLDIKADIINIYDYFYTKSNILVVHDFWKYRFTINLHDLIRHIYCLIKHCYFRYTSVQFIIRDILGMCDFEEDEINELRRIFCIKKKYEMEENTQKKVYYLKNLLDYCFRNRDIKTALEYLNILETDFSLDHYNELKRELEIILSEMKGRIKSRKTEDIIINWIDGVSYQKIEDLPYIHAITKNGVNFSNAYTMMPWTTWTMKVMFSGKKLIEGELWKQSRITEKNSILLNRLKKKGYEFCYAGSEMLREKLFCKNLWLSQEKCSYVPSTRFMWDALDRLASDSTKQCILIHELIETHAPMFSVKSEKFTNFPSKIQEEQKKGGRLYIDEQIEWMDSFFGKSITEIYMSDHGDNTINDSDKARFSTDKTNIIMLIRSEKMERKEYKSFFSIVRFPYLLGGVMGWWCLKEKELLSDDILLEAYDAYSPEYVEPMMVPEKNLDISLWMQFRAIRTYEDILVKFANGEKKYFRLPDDKHSIDDEKYLSRIELLSEKLGDDFIDIYKEDFFVNSRKLYQKLKEQEGK